MPAYRYENFVNPYSQSIGELLGQQGAIEARRAEAVAAASARAAEQSGAAWSGAAQQIGQTVGNAITQNADPKAKLERLQLGEAERGVKARSVLGAAVSTTPHVDEDGVSLYDVPTISKKLEDAGFGDHVADVATQLKGLNDAFRSEQQAKLATVRLGSQSLLQANADPELTLHFIDTLDKNNSWPKDQLDYFRQIITKDPTKTGAILQQFAGPTKVVMGAPGATPINELTGKPIGAALPDDPDKGDYTINGQRFKKDGTPIGAAVAPQVTPAAAQTHNMRLKGVGDVPVDYVPNKDGSGGTWMYQGKDVTGDVSAIPAASLTIRNDKQEQGATDRGEIVDMIRRGQMAPSMLSKRTDDYDATLAELNRQSKAETGKPFNLNKAELDYQAARRWVQNQNGPQMLRFKGLAGSVVNTIDEVKRLGDELKQGSIQKWNSVSRKTVQQLYGNTPESKAANDYMIAVNTLKEEFANLANGGYAPTDAAWGLANSQINGDYGFKDLASSLTEVQRLINYRVNAFGDVAPTTFGGPATGGAPTPTGGQPITVGGFTVTVH